MKNGYVEVLSPCSNPSLQNISFQLINENNQIKVIQKVETSTLYQLPPSKPQNLQVTSSANNHPILTWSVNTEPDLSDYRIYKKLTTESGTQTAYITTTSTSYTDTDFEITSPRLATDGVEYWVVTVDLDNNLSVESSHIIKTGESLIQWKKSLE